jgi:hypothetical protein
MSNQFCFRNTFLRIVFEITTKLLVVSFLIFRSSEYLVLWSLSKHSFENPFPHLSYLNSKVWHFICWLNFSFILDLNSHPLKSNSKSLNLGNNFERIINWWVRNPLLSLEQLYLNKDKNNFLKLCIHMYFGHLSSNMKEFFVGHEYFSRYSTTHPIVLTLIMIFVCKFIRFTRDFDLIWPNLT